MPSTRPPGPAPRSAQGGEDLGLPEGPVQRRGGHPAARSLFLGLPVVLPDPVCPASRAGLGWHFRGKRRGTALGPRGLGRTGPRPWQSGRRAASSLFPSRRAPGAPHVFIKICRAAVRRRGCGTGCPGPAGRPLPEPGCQGPRHHRPPGPWLPVGLTLSQVLPAGEADTGSGASLPQQQGGGSPARGGPAAGPEGEGPGAVTAVTLWQSVPGPGGLALSRRSPSQASTRRPCECDTGPWRRSPRCWAAVALVFSSGQSGPRGLSTHPPPAPAAPPPPGHTGAGCIVWRTPHCSPGRLCTPCRCGNRGSEWPCPKSHTVRAGCLRQAQWTA